MGKIRFYNKLIRDNMPSIIEKNGKSHNTIILDSKAFLVELKKKLIEEAIELNAAESKLDVLNELSDVTEIIDSLMKEYHISEGELLSRKLEKRSKNGSFEKKLFLISVTEEGKTENE